MKKEITEFYNRIRSNINNLTDSISNEYENMKKKTLLQNFKDIINYIINFIIKYIYIIVGFIAFLFLFSFLTKSQAPLAVLFRHKLSFYETKPYNIKVQGNALND
jgi:predicted PurR-regulated permease PerM